MRQTKLTKSSIIDLSEGLLAIGRLRDVISKRFSVYLRTAKKMFVIESEMTDIAERLEVGVLSISAAESFDDVDFIDLPNSFCVPLKAEILVLKIEGHQIASGFSLATGDGSSIEFTPGDAPYSVALISPALGFNDTSEYEVEKYERILANAWRA